MPSLPSSQGPSGGCRHACPSSQLRQVLPIPHPRGPSPLPGGGMSLPAGLAPECPSSRGPDAALCLADRPCPMDCPATEEGSVAGGPHGRFHRAHRPRNGHGAALVRRATTRPACTSAPGPWPSAGTAPVRWSRPGVRCPRGRQGWGSLMVWCRGWPCLTLAHLQLGRRGTQSRGDRGPQLSEGDPSRLQNRTHNRAGPRLVSGRIPSGLHGALPKSQ